MLLLVLAVSIAGFLARRLLMPNAAHYLTSRAPEYPAQAQPTHSGGAQTGEAQGAGRNGNGSGENLTDSDRRALDEVIKRKNGAQ